MSRFHGSQGKGALARHREKKRQEATKRAENRQVAQNLTALADKARAAAQATVVTAAGVFVNGERVKR